jgi:hypothetical protein
MVVHWAAKTVRWKAEHWAANLAPTKVVSWEPLTAALKAEWKVYLRAE